MMRFEKFDNQRTFETTLAGRPLIVETGKMAQLSNGSCLVRYGDTAILCNVTASAKPREGVDFFPMSVDYEEKMYSVGKIPGSFQRRENRPSEKAILTSRVIDRPIRPLFPKDMRNDVTLVCTVMSVDPDCQPETTAMIGASIAIAISDIPWAGPISGVVVGMVDGKFVINPTAEQEKVSEMHVTVASTSELVAMIEAGANEIDNDTMFDAIMEGHKANQQVVEFINSIVAEIGKIDECMYKLQKYVVRRWLLDDGKRVDGRGINDMRPLAGEVGLLPRVHGSGMFTRGQTQVLTTCTLASTRDAQLLDGLDDQREKRYMHHYNFPSYSVGETKPSRGPGRREIGHGALAERALLPVIPSAEEFPYTIRLVSEVLSSNGSTSQAILAAPTALPRWKQNSMPIPA